MLSGIFYSAAEVVSMDLLFQAQLYARLLNRYATLNYNNKVMSGSRLNWEHDGKRPNSHYLNNLKTTQPAKC